MRRTTVRRAEAVHEAGAALLARLDGIALSLARRPGTLALLGLGSVGADLSRLDAYSDLDFFVIAERGYVEPLIGRLDWLEDVAPIAFAFQNTRDGSKVLFEDGIYAEFAVFDPDTVESIPFAGPRLVWQRDGVDLSHAFRSRTASLEPPATEWLLGEILTNLYVGLTRLGRGEALAAQRLIQAHAVDRLLDLLPAIERPTRASRDPFDGTRRAEQRFPQTAPSLARFVQGYERSPESAVAILDLLKPRFVLHPALTRRIEELATQIMAGRAEMPDPIEIIPYRAEWIEEFRAIARRLRQGLGDSALRIDHIGSTAVPGLPAKDVIDVQVTVASLDPVEPIRLGIQQAGYMLNEAIGEDHRPPGEVGPTEDWIKRFAREALGEKRTHIHIRQEGRRNQRYALLFRDYLRAHPLMAEAYARLKYRLAEYHRGDRIAYVEIKDPAVDLIALPAEEWAARTGWELGPPDA